jgi:hypothetical protein
VDVSFHKPSALFPYVRRAPVTAFTLPLSVFADLSRNEFGQCKLLFDGSRNSTFRVSSATLSTVTGPEDVKALIDGCMGK